MFVYTSTSSITTPSGWSVAVNATVWFGSLRGCLFYRTADGGSDDTPTVTVGSGTWITVIIRANGQHATPLGNTTSNNGSDPVGDPYTLSDIVIADNGTLLVAASGSNFSSGTAVADLSADGYTVRATSSPSGNDFAIWTGEFNASTDGGTSIDFTGGIRGAAVLAAFIPAAATSVGNIPPLGSC